jgi:hypothetical protein
MITEYKYRGIFLITKSNRSAINNAIKADLDKDGGKKTFTIGASSTGGGGPTYYYANSALTAEAVAKIADMAVAFPSSKGWVWVDHESGSASLLNNTFNSISNIEVVEKTLDNILSENGLQRMESV